jgi:hypothetical protein
MAERDELRIPQFRGDLAKWAGRPKARLPCCGDDGGHSRLPFRRFARSRELATKGPSRARVRSVARMESGEASARPRAPKPRRSARSVLFGQSLAAVPGPGARVLSGGVIARNFAWRWRSWRLLGHGRGKWRPCTRALRQRSFLDNPGFTTWERASSACSRRLAKFPRIGDRLSPVRAHLGRR